MTFEMTTTHGMIRSVLNACVHGASGATQWATSAQVLSIISQAVERFSADPPLLNLSGQFTIIGDLHGDILSVVRIFQKLGWPDSRSYVFLGDYVDRGECSCEVLVLLYCLKILFPGNIFLLRGNHEFPAMMQLYGFQAECAAKFLRKVYAAFVDSFLVFPIAAIINEAVFCVHGGIVPGLGSTIDDLAKISEGASVKESEILWSDPNDNVEGFRASRRGRGFQFGPDVFDAFLQETGLTMMIRAHEHCTNGFDWPFGTDGRILTVFSAVDYCQKGNDGAVAVVTGSDVRVIRFPFKNSDRLRVLIPYFVLEADTVSLTEITLTTREDESHLFIEIF
jgi:diadenosine tetraphosphatase ApaH/serine/threonine PP2A family protein phosphatase